MVQTVEGALERKEGLLMQLRAVNDHVEAEGRAPMVAADYGTLVTELKQVCCPKHWASIRQAGSKPAR